MRHKTQAQPSILHLITKINTVAQKTTHVIPIIYEFFSVQLYLCFITYKTIATVVISFCFLDGLLTSVSNISLCQQCCLTL